MAAAISALNAKIRSQPVLNYVCSTRTYTQHPMAPISPRLCSPTSPATTPQNPLPLTPFPYPLQISGAQSQTSAFRSPRSWTRRKTRTCTSPPLSLFPACVSQHRSIAAPSPRGCRTFPDDKTPRLIGTGGKSISGKMTAALSLYSGTFMRYALAVTPKNYLLFGCHVVNFGAQLTQGWRYVHYWQ